MKRTLLLLLAISILLLGCHSEPVPSETAVATPSVTEESTEPTRAFTLMDFRQPIGSGNNVWYIPNEAVESPFSPTPYAFGEDLLLDSYLTDYDESGETIEQSLELKLISLADGALIAQKTLPIGGAVIVQTYDDRICLSDSSAGMVTILDGGMNQIAQYQVEANIYAQWYVSADMKTLYCFDMSSGLYAIDLHSGARVDLISDAMQLYVCDHSSRYVVFLYTDGRTQLDTNGCLDLETGIVEATPFEGALGSSTSRNGDLWVSSNVMDMSSYTIVTSAARRTVFWKEHTISALLPQKHLLAADSHRRNLMLYHPDGTFISHCDLPKDEMSYAGTDLIWSDYWGGYFFLDYNNGEAKLIFWDIGAESSGENLQLRDMQEPSIPDGGVVDATLYDRARELSDRFGVDIRIADQCQLDYGYYTSDMEINPDYIAAALDTLDACLSNYPEGFFSQLRYGNVRSLRIELVDNPMPVDDSLAPSAAFAQELQDHNLIVMDTYSVLPWNIYHEIAHIFDNRLTFDAGLRPDALFSEGAWLALQPEGFDYAYSYWEMPEYTRQYIDSGYFRDSYACTFPTEDRAELMEAAMCCEPIFADNEKLREKLAFYSKCIRDCFDTTGWPTVTLWEQALGVG
ncbi:hypothetical protein [Paenibacillus sp.]